MKKLTLGTLLCAASVTAATAAGFDPDPDGKYDVMRGILTHNLPTQVAHFEDMIDGSDNCAPQLFLDRDDPGFITVTLLAPCYQDAEVTLLHYGKSQHMLLSQNGAGFARIESVTGAGRVTAAFQGGTVLMGDIAAPQRSAALIASD